MALNGEPFILIVEDDPDQAALIQAAFKKGRGSSPIQPSPNLSITDDEPDSLRRPSGGGPTSYYVEISRSKSRP